MCLEKLPDTNAAAHISLLRAEMVSFAKDVEGDVCIREASEGVCLSPSVAARLVALFILWIAFVSHLFLQ